jgi:hypothetical protein
MIYRYILPDLGCKRADLRSHPKSGKRLNSSSPEFRLIKL